MKILITESKRILFSHLFLPLFLFLLPLWPIWNVLNVCFAATTPSLPSLSIDTLGAPLAEAETNEIPIELWPPDRVDPLAASLKVRGRFSRGFPKKNFKVELGKKDSLFNLGKGEEWVLHGPYYDRSLIRNTFAYHLGRQINHFISSSLSIPPAIGFSPQAQLLELTINNDYQGVYALIEKIERGEERLSIPPFDVTNPWRSPFMAKVDSLHDQDNILETALGTKITLIYPKQTKLQKMVDQGKITAEQRDLFLQVLKQRLDAFESSLSPANFHHPQAGFRQKVNEHSALLFLLMQEITKNPDGLMRSLHFFDPGDGQIHFGPLWDFDLSMGNFLFTPVWKNKGWLVGSLSSNLGLFREDVISFEVFWFKNMVKDPLFVRKFREYYFALRSSLSPLETSSLHALIDQQVDLIRPALTRNFTKWPILGKPRLRYWMSPPPWPQTHAGEIDKIKDWLRKRLHWMDESIQALGQ